MLIINGKILTMTGKPVECGYVRTEGKVITEVGTMSALDKRHKGEEVLDVDGAWVMPGLIELTPTLGSLRKSGVP